MSEVYRCDSCGQVFNTKISSFKLQHKKRKLRLVFFLRVNGSEHFDYCLKCLKEVLTIIMEGSTYDTNKNPTPITTF